MIPQMSPMKWLYISLLCNFNFVVIMFILNSIPIILNFKSMVYTEKVLWKWFW